QGYLSEANLAVSGAPVLGASQHSSVTDMALAIPAYSDGPGAVSRTIYINGISAEAIFLAQEKGKMLAFRVTEMAAQWNGKDLSWPDLGAGWVADSPRLVTLYVINKEKRRHLYIFEPAPKATAQDLLQQLDLGKPALNRRPRAQRSLHEIYDSFDRQNVQAIEELDLYNVPPGGGWFLSFAKSKRQA